MINYNALDVIVDSQGFPVSQYYNEEHGEFAVETTDGSVVLRTDVDFRLKRLILDSDGFPLPQLWDPEQGKFVPRTKSNGSGGGSNVDLTEINQKLSQTEEKLSDLITLKPSGKTDGTDGRNIQQALNNGMDVRLAKGNFYVTEPINLPETTSFKFKGEGINLTNVIANEDMDYVFYKGTGINMGSYIGDFTVMCNLKAQRAFRIISMRKPIIERVYVTNWLYAALDLGGNTAIMCYGMTLTDCQFEYRNTNPAETRPDYGVVLQGGANDNRFINTTIANVKITGWYDDHYSNNRYTNCHTYGFPFAFRNQYAMILHGGCEVTQFYADSATVAGIKIISGNVTVADSFFYWPSSLSDPFCFEFEEGVDLVQLIGNQYRNYGNPELIKYNGNPGRRNFIVGINETQLSGDIKIKGRRNTPARLYLNTPDRGQDASLYWQQDGVNRWSIAKNNAAENGVNDGSDFIIKRFSDNGTVLSDGIRIKRDTGELIVPNNFNAQKNVELQQRVKVRGTWEYPFVIGGACMWVISGKVRIKFSGDPTHADDGVVIADSNGI